MGLENLFCWVPWLIRWLVGWVPHFGRLHKFQRGVKVGGNNVKLLRPGFYFWLPHFSDVFADNVVRKVQVLPEQVLTTKDGACVRAGGLLVYTIEDIEVWLLENDDPDSGLLNEACRVLRDWVRTKSFSEVLGTTAADEDELTMAATDAMAVSFGVDVQRLGLTSFARTFSANLSHSGRIGIKDLIAPSPMIPVGE